MTECDFATTVVRTLQAAGFQALFAGGCVRDRLLGLTPADYDVATNATSEQVQSLFRRTIAIGASFGVIEVLGPKVDGDWLKVQVATFRSDGVYLDGRRPESVTFGTAEDDAQRRDFTINGLFYDPVADQLHDFIGGRADLDARILRAIGDPIARFREDKLRLMRAVRMATRFNLAIDSQTLAAARAMAGEITVVSPERIAEELRKLLSAPNRTRGLSLLNEFGLLPAILPEIVATIDDAVRISKVFNENLDFEQAMAELLRHVTPAVARKVCRRLKLSNSETDGIVWLVTMQSSLHTADTLPSSRLYPILAHPWAAELLSLAYAIAVVDNRSMTSIEFAQNLHCNTPLEVFNPPPLLTGDLLVAHGWSPGPEFKRILERVRSAQLDGEVLTEAQAWELAQRLLAS